MPTLISSLIQNILIPEIAVAIRAHHAATGQMPTDAQILAALGTDVDGLVARGEAFLASKGIAPAAPAVTPPATDDGA